MKFFSYVAKDKKGFPCRGSVKAEDENDAIKILSLRGMVIEELELDLEATKKLRPETIANLAVDMPKKSKWNNILAYAMPIGAMVIALIGIPIMMNYVKPPVPDMKPEQVIAQYFELENKGAYKEQYELLTEATAEIFGNEKNYAKKKNKWYRRSDGKNLSRGKLTGLEELDRQLRHVSFKSRYLRMSGVDELEIHLLLKRSGWKIDSVRDPAVKDYYLNVIFYSKKESQKNKYRQELKAVTGYSDIEIDEALKKLEYRQNARK